MSSGDGPSVVQPSPVAAPSGSTRRQGVLRRILLYGASRGTADGLLALRGLALASVLGPEAFGAWALFRLACRYAGLFALGVHRGVEYEVVHARARGTQHDERDADLFGRAALAYVLAAFGGVALIALTGSFFVADPRLAAGVRAFAAGILVEQLWLYAVVNLRARGELRRFAVNEVVNGALQLLFTIGLALAFSLQGAYAGFVIAATLSVALVARRVPMRPQWSTQRLLRLLRIGVPIAMVLISGLVLTTADRFVVAAIGGTAMLGMYAFAVAIASLATTAAWVVRTVIFPSVYERAAGEGADIAIEEHARRTILPFATLFPPLLGLAAIAMGPAVALLLPQFTEAVMPARIFIFTGVVAGVSSLTSVGVVAAARQRMLPPFSVAAVVLNVMLSVLALRTGLGLPGVAAAALFSQALFAATTVAIMARAGNMASPVRLIHRTLLPLLWSAGTLAVMMIMLPMRTVRQAAVGMLIYAILQLPLAPAFLALGRGLRRTFR